jgi:ribosomal protein L23
MWVFNEEDIDEQKVISYVKIVPKSPIIMVTFTDGETIEMNENKCYTFEVNQKLEWKKATRKQIKQSIENI